MATAYAKINPDILSWARDRAQLSFSALAEKLGIAEEKLEAWEDGEKPMTFRQAQTFANKTHIPFGYLFLKQPPEEQLPLPDLRTVGGAQPQRPSSELLDMVRIVLQRQSWYHDYLSEQEMVRNPVVARCNVNTPVAEIVHDMRTMLGVAPHPERGSWEEYNRALIKNIEAVGILVMRQGNLGHWSRTLSVSEFRGFAVADPVAPVIFINTSDAPSARLFTLIHELTHIWIGQSGISDGEPGTHRQEEVLCNAVAAEFLVPETEFNREWQDGLENWRDNLAPLEAHFHVSKWVLARRAQTLNKISLQAYREFVAELLQRHRNRESRGDGGPAYYRTRHAQVSDRFSRAVVSEALSGRLLLRDAGRLLNMKPNHINNYARELGV
jgi:Zn-dependent peptidase ImmA (M78 family)